jgi:hypothetical protein
MPAYHAAFDCGENVVIADAATLLNFQRSWEWHHPLIDEQIAYAGQNDSIKRVTTYHGGAQLYEFVSIPGVWHEPCLRDPTLGEGYDLEAGVCAADYYTITTDRRGGLPVVVVRDPEAREMLVAFQFAVEIVAESLREVARVRSRIAFEFKYGFCGIYETNKHFLRADGHIPVDPDV